jgi:hypothetical protein
MAEFSTSTGLVSPGALQLDPVIARDLANLATLLAEFLQASGAAKTALRRFTADRPGYQAEQIITDLHEYARDLDQALPHVRNLP